MAVAVSCFSLTSKEFPSKFENVFVPRRRTQNESQILSDYDRRRRINPDEKDVYPGIGLLRMEFKETILYGTATMIANGTCVLTCAHNVVEYDQISKEFMHTTSAWFELRKSKAGSKSDLIERYVVTKIAVYPKYYEDPKSESGFDLALCWIEVPENDHTVKELYSTYEMPIPLVKEHAPTCAGVMGFPVEYEGAKGGMVAHVPRKNIKNWKLHDNREIFVYQFIDTSAGQSGSPFMGMKPSEILGVHTGGNKVTKKNWATAITSAKLQWIANCLGTPWRVGNDLYLCVA